MGPPYPHPCRPTRLSCSSTATHSNSSDPSRRNIHRKENQFVNRNGSKLHAYDREKAPYPSSFDGEVVELQSLDNAVLLESKGKSSYVDFEGKPKPTRCLDIGTGLGLWVISTAKLWPEATFVGLDMVNMQIPLQVLEQEIAERIEWVHSNILRNKLPFEDEEFDHVHINGIALGVPENKYQSPPFAPFAPLTPIRNSTIPLLPRAISHPSNGAGSSIPLRNGSPPSSPRTEAFSNGGSLRTSPSSTLRLSPEEVAKCDSSPSSSVTSLPHIDAPEVPLSPPRDPEAVSMLSTTSQAGSYSSGSTSSKSTKRPSVMLEGTSLGGELAIDIFPVEKVQSQDEQTKYMHLYRTVTWVLSTKEAMWDELLVHVQSKDEILKKFGWTQEDYNEQTSRARFECAIDQYQSDMRGRIALWNCAVHNGWELPFPDPLTRAEVDEGIQLRREILEAQRLADNGDIEPPVRKIRILIGSKES
ncbi:hypothetical protein GSI_06439 [Ganoderma sinense ZZ0214-1]|uniref:Methyltransferase domain-containing protein n=1 Tax=Ganoderma sinense ZZ0214-1 TaxID=1077348 RepID=A0A2G8SD81_9APHY|nr:hypothetical protein GSI_06439 [Ganoderma sinense ZZ0214-1]